ncbi:hypothetical protein [Roseibium sediminis]|uniref:hypothetical protein n=1 Tax=Roseibium sediminis TaxID=1775174 RepID=UPI0013757846|nr:hypothetical protein [Roseibium sediminis]
MTGFALRSNSALGCVDELAMYFAGKFSAQDKAKVAQAMWCIVEPDLHYPGR